MEGYVKFYRELLCCSWLSSNDKVVYIAIADRFDFLKKVDRLTEQKMMELSIRRLAEQTGIDRRAVRKSIDRLCDVGLITEHKTIGGKSYYVADVEIDEVADFLRLGSVQAYGCGAWQPDLKEIV